MMRLKFERHSCLFLFLGLLLSTMFVVIFQIQTVEADANIRITADYEVLGTNLIEKVNSNTFEFIDNIEGLGIFVGATGIILDGKGYSLTGLGEDSGVYLNDVERVIIRNLNIQSFMQGITLEDSGLCILEKNVVSYNYEDGIELKGNSRSNKISENIILGNQDDGISLSDTSNQNTIHANIIRENDVGININDNSNYNIFSNNDFINNDEPFGDYNNQINIWNRDYPTGGNYWSDYAIRFPSLDVDLHSGPDQNQYGFDGIWDHPYYIYPSEDIKDSYPLTEPFTNKTPTSISCYASKETNEVDKITVVTIHVKIIPEVTGANVKINLKREGEGWDSGVFVTTDSEGAFEYSRSHFLTEKLGEVKYFAKASWEGNEAYYGDHSEQATYRIDFAEKDDAFSIFDWVKGLPGFPWESILIGSILGLGTIFMLRKKRMSAS